MDDLIIRPTAKFVKAGAIAAGAAALALEILYLMYGTESVSHWVMILPPLLLLWPGLRWLRLRFTKTVISGDRLRHQTGLTTRSTRTIQLSKIQDVRVDQRVGQRIFGIGNLSFETAGETSRLTLENVDSPQALADDIMNRVQHGAAAAGPETHPGPAV